MARVKRDEIIVGLDIGTTKIAAIVGEVTEDGIDIIGIGTSRSRGLRKGVVVNIDATVHAIQQAIREAEHMAATSRPSMPASPAATSADSTRTASSR
jgi:cell division protein FtsA